MGLSKLSALSNVWTHCPKSFPPRVEHTRTPRLPCMFFPQAQSQRSYSHFYGGRWWGAWTLRRGNPWRPRSRRAPAACSSPGTASPGTRRSGCESAACWSAPRNPPRAPAAGPAPATGGWPADANGGTSKAVWSDGDGNNANMVHLKQGWTNYCLLGFLLRPTEVRRN